jgi:hypothetical protein
MENNKKIDTMKQMLDDLYGDLVCEIRNTAVIWCKNDKIIAGLSKSNNSRLKLSKNEFNIFRNMFSLPWEEPKDDKLLIELITPYLKFDGGSLAIPILIKLRFIDEITNIGLPSNWD